MAFATSLHRGLSIGTPGVWGVRNYHSTLERRAEAGAEITSGYFAMVFASALLATAGLLLNSPAAVIGSMCVAPFMAPSRAVCIGLMFRNRRVFFGGLAKQLLGLLIIGSGLAYLLTRLLADSFPDLAITHEILLRAMPTSLAVALSAIVAISAGIAASLALTAQPHIVETPWGQVIDAVIGVEIAISLIPPAAVVGIGLALGKAEVAFNASLLLLLNVIGLDFIGSVLILGLRGIRERDLLLEKQIRAVTQKTLDVVPGFVSVGSTVDVTLFSETCARLDVILRRHFGGEVPVTLAERIAAEVQAATECRTEVTVEVIPLLTYSNMPVA